jgi:ABC-type transport system involved in multi-copper enzyme maturation permease subunit
VTTAGPATGEPVAEAPTVPAAAVVLSDATNDPGRFAGISAIWLRELRGRMRGKRAFLFLTFYLSLLATILWLALRTSESLPLSLVDLANIGRGIFGAVILVETLVVVALAPAYTAGSITSEREKQTYDLLAVTPISSLSLVIGKLLSGLSYLAIIVFASFPFACLAFVFGGVGPEDVLRGYLVLVATGLGVGAIGVWCSAAMGRSQTATVAAYLATAALIVGASAAWVGLDSRAAEEGSDDRPPQLLLLTNPFLAQLDVLCQTTGDGCWVDQAAQPRNRFGGPVVIDQVTGQPVDLGQGFVPQPAAEGGTFWPKAVLAYLGITALALYGASQSISPTRRWRWRPRLRAPRLAPPEAPTDG